MPSDCFIKVNLCRDDCFGFIVDADDSAYYGFTQLHTTILKYDQESQKNIYVPDMIARPARWTLEGECFNPMDSKKDIDPYLYEEEIWRILSYQSQEIIDMVSACAKYAEYLENVHEHFADLTYMNKQLKQDYGHMKICTHIIEGAVRLGFTKDLNKKHVLMARS